LALCACGECEHEWTAADCVNGAVCTKCGVAGETALGHEWAAATCELPETCSRCAQTQGEPLGHDWADATCELPKTCFSCGQTQGAATGHSFGEWSVTKTDRTHECTSCGLTETEEIDEATYLLHRMQGRWDLYLAQWGLLSTATAIDYLYDDLLPPYIEVEDVNIKLYVNGKCAVEFRLEPDKYEHIEQGVQFYAYASDGSQLILMLTDEESVYGREYVIFSYSGYIFTFENQHKAIAAGLYWVPTPDNSIYSIMLREDGTFNADFEETVNGHWLTGSVEFSEEDESTAFYDLRFILYYEEDGKRILLNEGDYDSLSFRVEKDEAGKVDWESARAGGLGIGLINEDYLTLGFTYIESAEAVEQIKKLMSERESKIVGSWRSTDAYVNNEMAENTDYTLTVNEDGTFTMQLDKEITGTWSYQTLMYGSYYVSFYYEVAGSPNERFVWEGDTGRLIYVHGDDQIFFSPVTE
jgi:hypothetical protein